MVKFEGQSGSAPKVIGFESNPKPCGFVFRLTRSDGVLLDSSQSVGIAVFDSSGVAAATTSAFHPNPETPSLGYWAVHFLPNTPIDAAGYWAEFSAAHCDTTQYHGIVDSGQMRQPSSLIKVGTYIDVLPKKWWQHKAEVLTNSLWSQVPFPNTLRYLLMAANIRWNTR